MAGKILAVLLAVNVSVAGVWAEEKQEQPAPSEYGVMMLRRLGLNDEQNKKVQGIIAEYAPKFAELQKEIDKASKEFNELLDKILDGTIKDQDAYKRKDEIQKRENSVYTKINIFTSERDSKIRNVLTIEQQIRFDRGIKLLTEFYSAYYALQRFGIDLVMDDKVNDECKDKVEKTIRGIIEDMKKKYNEAIDMEVGPVKK